MALDLSSIQSAISDILQSAVPGTPVTNAYPWVPGNLSTLPSFFIVPPDVRPQSSPLGTTRTWLVNYAVYYVDQVTPGTQAPQEDMLPIQEAVLDALDDRTALRELDAFIENVSSSIENPFTHWARLLSKPYIAVMFVIPVFVDVEE